MHKTPKILFAIFLPFFLFSATPVLGYEFFITATKDSAVAGERIPVSVYLDTSGESINAIDGEVVTLPQADLTEVNDAGSAVSFWIEHPAITQSGVIHFSGIIPNGFVGNKIPLFSFVVVDKKRGGLTVGFKNTHAFLNDGTGTEAKGGTKNYSIDFHGGTTPTLIDNSTDTEPPESFVPLLGNDKNIFDGKYFVVFSTQDKQSGIDHYEVAEQEGFISLTYNNLPWKVAESPYLLFDQTQESNIYVKAVDKHGNIRVIWLAPHNQPLIYSQNIIFGILLLTGVVVWCLVRRNNGFYKTSV